MNGPGPFYTTILRGSRRNPDWKMLGSYPPGNGYISHRKGSSENHRLKYAILGGYVSSLEVILIFRFCVFSFKFCLELSPLSSGQWNLLLNVYYVLSPPQKKNKF